MLVYLPTMMPKKERGLTQISWCLMYRMESRSNQWIGLDGWMDGWMMKWREREGKMK